MPWVCRTEKLPFEFALLNSNPGAEDARVPSTFVCSQYARVVHTGLELFTQKTSSQTRPMLYLGTAGPPSEDAGASATAFQWAMNFYMNF